MSNITISSPSENDDAVERIDKSLDDTNSFIATNIQCFAIFFTYKIIQQLVFGTLRVSEQLHIRDTFTDYFIQKMIFLVFVLDAKSLQEKGAWPIWYFILCSTLLLARTCRDRFEYLSSTPTTKFWSLIRISILITFLLFITVICNYFVFVRSFSKFYLFLFADAIYVYTFVISVITRIAVVSYDMRTNSVWENRAAVIYYSDLIFAIFMFTIDLAHQLHLIVIGQVSLLVKLFCLLRLNTLSSEIRRRYRKHRNMLTVIQLMESSFPMASDEEIEKNSDDCAICWDIMESARRLPCGHLFHNSCLRSWLEQDTSCPTCRTSVKGEQENPVEGMEGLSESDEEWFDATRSHQRSPLFHFDSSRYTNNPLLSWLPTISIEGFM